MYISFLAYGGILCGAPHSFKGTQLKILSCLPHTRPRLFLFCGVPCVVPVRASLVPSVVRFACTPNALSCKCRSLWRSQPPPPRSVPRRGTLAGAAQSDLPAIQYPTLAGPRARAAWVERFRCRAAEVGRGDTWRAGRRWRNDACPQVCRFGEGFRRPANKHFSTFSKIGSEWGSFRFRTLVERFIQNKYTVDTVKRQ